MIDPEDCEWWKESCVYCGIVYPPRDLMRDWKNEGICKRCYADGPYCLCPACEVVLDPEEKDQVVKSSGKYRCGKCGAVLDTDGGELDGYDIEERGDE